MPCRPLSSMGAASATALSPRAAAHVLRLVVCLGLLIASPLAYPQALLDQTAWTERLAAADADQRRASIHALADLGGVPAVELLAARLEQEPDDAMRRAIHDALLRVQVDQGELIGVLADSPIDAARAFAAHALGHHHTLSAVSALLDAIRDPEPSVRREVYEALGASGDRGAIQELIKAAVRETSPGLREQAEQAAQRLASESGRPREVLVAISMLQGGNLDDQMWAIEVLAESGDWRAFQVLLDTANNAAPDPQREAIKALGVLGDHRAVPVLLGMLETTRGRTLHHAIGALALLRDESSIEPLGVLVHDQDPACRVLAIRALSALEHAEIVPRILPALQDSEELVRIEAIHALGASGAGQATAGLVQAMDDPSPFLRAESARLLAGSGSSAAEGPLLAALDDRDPLVRLTAAEGLARLGSEAALPRLQELAGSTRQDDERLAYEQAIERLRGSAPSP